VRKTVTAVVILLNLHFSNAQTVDTLAQPAVADTSAAIAAESAFGFANMDSLLVQTGSVTSQVMQPRRAEAEWIIPCILLLLLAYVTLLRVQYPRQLGENITVIVNQNLGQQIYRDREFSAGIFSLLIFLNFVLVSAVFLYQLLSAYGFPGISGNKYLDIAIYGLLIPAIYFARSLVYGLLSLIYPFKAELNFFRFNTRVLLQMTGICLLPFAILMATTDSPVSQWALYCGAGVLICVYIIRIIKGVQIGGGFARFHFFYFLIYLCTLEIAPLLILIKVIGNLEINS